MPIPIDLHVTFNVTVVYAKGSNAGRMGEAFLFYQDVKNSPHC